MSSVLKGKDILNALIYLKNPAGLNEIVEHLSANTSKLVSKTELLESAKEILDAGVRFGCILEKENQYCIEDINSQNVQQVECKGLVDETTALQNINDVHIPGSSVAKPKKKAFTKLLRTPSPSSNDDEDELNDYQDRCGTNFSRRKRSRSRNNSKRRSSRRRRRHG